MLLASLFRKDVRNNCEQNAFFLTSQKTNPLLLWNPPSFITILKALLSDCYPLSPLAIFMIYSNPRFCAQRKTFLKFFWLHIKIYFSSLTGVSLPNYFISLNMFTQKTL
jgi:hypothetical protein